MSFRLLADAGAQTTIALALTSGATSFVGGATANFTQPQNFGNGVGRLTFLDAGNPAWNQNAPFATPFEYADFTNNNTGTNTISGLTRGVGGTTAHNFFAGAIVAQGFLVEDIIASVPWKYDEQNPTGVSSITIPPSGLIPASYLGVSFRDIQIRWKVRTTSGNSSDLLQMQFNADTGNNYAFEQLVASGSSVTAANSGATSVARVGGPAGGANTAPTAFGVGVIDIIDAFSSTTRRQYGTPGTYGVDANGVPNVSIFTGQWFNAANPITSITIFVSAGNFAAGSRITTYLIP